MSDEGDFKSMQYWSENHYITYNAAAYLIGSWLTLAKAVRQSHSSTLSINLGYGFEMQPELQDVVFNPSGLNGSGLRQAASERVREWLDYRNGSNAKLNTFLRKTSNETITLAEYASASGSTTLRCTAKSHTPQSSSCLIWPPTTTLESPRRASGRQFAGRD